MGNSGVVRLVGLRCAFGIIHAMPNRISVARPSRDFFLLWSSPKLVSAALKSPHRAAPRGNPEAPPLEFSRPPDRRRRPRGDTPPCVPPATTAHRRRGDRRRAAVPPSPDSPDKNISARL